MITETNAFHPTTKAAVAKAIAELGVELSASRVKKTPRRPGRRRQEYLCPCPCRHSPSTS